MATEPRPGSMAAADAKSNKNLAIGMTVLNLILLIIIFFVVDKEWNKGTGLGKAISVIAIVVSTYLVWQSIFNKWNWLSPNVGRAIWVAGIIIGLAAPRIF